jgi:hypothetical protein
MTYSRLLTPFFSRPEPPVGERALMLARLRERTARWLTPMPEDEPYHRSGRKWSGGHAIKAKHPGKLGRPRRVTDEQVAEMSRLWAEGVTLERLGATYGLSAAGVAYVMRARREET